MSAIQEAPLDTTRITPAVEDYLKTIYQLRGEHPQAGAVTGQRIAERLGVAAPSVTNMVKRLHELDLVRHEPYRGVELTEVGERIALEVVRHHRLLERYLVEALGYTWDEVHEEADRLEHHISEALEARMATALGNPLVDPHGDPIPQPDGSIAAVAALPLLELTPGDTGIVQRVSDRDPELLRYLEEIELRPGMAVTLLATLPFEGPLRVRVGEREQVIGRPLAAAVQVSQIAGHRQRTV